MLNRHHERSRGMALALVLITLFVLSVLGFALAIRGIQNLASSSTADADADAFYAAQAGISRSLYALERSDSALPSKCTCTTNPYCSGAACTNSPSFSGGNVLLNQATFTLSVTSNGPSSTFPVTASDGTWVPLGDTYVLSTGKAGSITKKAFAMFNLMGGGWPFQYAVFGHDTVNVQNGSTDSYSSASGLYGGSNVASNGNIGTDGNTAGVISFGPHGIVAGTTQVGPGGAPGPPDVTESGCSKSSGGCSVLSSAVNFPVNIDPLGGPGSAPPPSSGTIPPGLYGDLTGGNVTLSCGGTYSFNSISIAGSSTITIPNCSINSPVKVYVYNTISVAGGASFSTDGEKATSLFLYGMPSCTTVSISGNGVMAAALYAPNAAVTLNGSGANGVYYGSYIGKSVDFHGSNVQVHYDSTLNNDIQAGSVTVTMESWGTR